MRVEWSEMAGVELHPARAHADARGSFFKLYESSGEPTETRQVCTSYNHRSGTLRGLHLQLPPHEETKLVWCTAGALLDVLVDTREDSATYGAWTSVELRADDPELLVVPRGVAHGYQTLVDGTAIAYVIDGVHAPEDARTLAWDDPEVGIRWPLAVTAISPADKDGAAWPLS